jgi:HlyD family secretion protein
MMAGGSSVAVSRDIQALFDSGTASGLSDRQLLDRFAIGHDATSEAAFEVLVLRHGPMVLRVCHNLLHDPNDAHDAFQATFLVLIRRSESIRKLDSVGGWLYGVACRVAARARVDAARRRLAEQRAALRIVEAVDPPDVDETVGMEFGPIVQEEVWRLPEKYRAVVALCYWQGLTQEQAAVQLGCPLGTVRSRLARARKLLQRRLIRRGLAPLAGVLTAGLDRAPAIEAGFAWRLAPVPRELVSSTIQAAVRIAGGHGPAPAVSTVAASLVQNVLWSMTMFKIKMVAVGVVLVGLVGSGGWFAASKGPLAQAEPKIGQKTPPPGEESKHEGSKKFYSVVRGQTTVIKLARDGSRVKKGEIVCELDSATLGDQLLDQKIAFTTAQANYENSKLVREVAEIAVVEYEEGQYKVELQETSGDIKIAEAELTLAEVELNVARESGDKLPVKRAELGVFRARFALEKAQSRQKRLVDFTRGKKIKELRSAVGKARSRELAQRAIWELQSSKLKTLDRQIANYTIVAPRDGTLIYAPRIEEGATVRDHQILFEIVPSSEAKAETR